MRKVTEEATMTLCSSRVRFPKPMISDGRPSTGTRLFTTAPTIRLRTGKEPTGNKCMGGWRKCR